MTRCVSMLMVIALIACTPASTRLSGTLLPNKDAAAFTLADGLTGQTVTLSSLRGNVIAMAFLYTHCPDVCPITASLFRAAQRQVGHDGFRFVAVSVDPEGDTPAAVREFSAAHDLSAGWHYLIGPRAQLQAVWTSYGVGAFTDPSVTGAVAHNDAIYVIDGKGRERELLHSDVKLADLVADLKALANEK